MMDWSILIGCGSLMVAIIAQILIASRNRKKDELERQKDAEERGVRAGELRESLREIRKDVSEIKIEQKSNSEKAETRHETIIKEIALLWASTKSAHKRIDDSSQYHRGA
jgi:TolA-binding protein